MLSTKLSRRSGPPCLLLFTLFATILLGGLSASAERKVLVTGFYDWKNLGDPPELQRCDENPSCRLLAGRGRGARAFQGPLADRLRALSAAMGTLQIDLALLPVTWGSAAKLSLADYDTVIHFGLGVRDPTQIKIEVGAYNLRRGVDAAGLRREGAIQREAPLVLSAPPAIEHGIERALKARLPAPLQLLRAGAREKNTYLCNETHYGSLTLVRGGQLREAYFIHIPQPTPEGENALAEALSRVVESILRRKADRALIKP